VRLAYAIENTCSKDDICEECLSDIYFGDGVRGLDPAARYRVIRR
jgi:membrane peptidoglycan carboxypeptidase